MEDCGFDASVIVQVEMSEEVSRLTLNVEGMMCAACVGAVDAAVLAVPGVKTATVSLLPRGSAVVKFDPNATGARDVVEAITEAGFEVRLGL